MKKEFGKLSRNEQEKVELKYHQAELAALDKLMSKAKPHSPEPALKSSKKSHARKAGSDEKF